MKRAGMMVWRLGVLLGCIGLSCWAAENRNQTGTILDVQRKAHTKVLYYLVNTPVTRDEPYFEVSVQIRDRIYTGEYLPRHAEELLPETWKPNAEVQLRLEKHSMYLRRPDGEESEFVITRRAAAPAPSQAQPAEPPRK
jgi:hypothetical protein